MKDELENCRLTNCTPHDVVIVGSNGVNSVTIPASGVLPRCAVTTEKVGEVKVDGVTIPLTSSHFGEVTGLPEASDGTLLRDTPTCVGKTQTYPPELAVECSVMLGALPRNPLKKIGKVFVAVTVHPDPLGEALAVAPGSVILSELIASNLLQPPLTLVAPDDAAKDVAASSWDLS